MGKMGVESQNSMKKLILPVLFLAFMAFPGSVSAEDEVIICPQPYGGGVVCGVKTHKPINTGIADNLPLLGAGVITVSSAIFYLSKKARVQA